MRANLPTSVPAVPSTTCDDHDMLDRQGVEMFPQLA